MIYNAREYARLRNTVLATSLIAWVILLKPGTAATACCGGDCATSMELLLASKPPSSLLLEILLASNPPSSLAGSWALMLLAMMLPMLVQPLYYVHISSFAHRRVRSLALFAVGYGGVWMVAGSVLVALRLAVSVGAPHSYLPAAVAGVVAVVWQTSPLKQRCLNQCHRHPALAAFGTAADRDALRMGLGHGHWCVGSCWAAMLFPLLLPHGPMHFVAMGAVGILMFCERLDPPTAPAWRWRGFGTAFRYVRSRLRAPRYSPAPWARVTRA